jgi:hypothetical protein
VVAIGDSVTLGEYPVRCRSGGGEYEAKDPEVKEVKDLKEAKDENKRGVPWVYFCKAQKIGRKERR